ncbi:hypothetical protein EMMF5_004725 [Cystobasidiomycetes sp. EMM_F5]
MSGKNHEPVRSSAEYNVASGQLKQSIGKIVDQSLGTNLHQAGVAQEDGGHAELKAADAVDYASGGGNRIQGKVDQVIGTIFGDSELKASGKAQEAEGVQMQAASAPDELRK